MKAQLIPALALMLALAPGAQAGIYTDDLSRCLVDSTTKTDKTELVRWVFATASAHPDVADIASVTPAQSDRMDYVIAKLFERLMTSDCLGQTRDALRYEGTGALEKSFEVLGQVAMTGLMSDPEVNQAFSRFSKHLDTSKFDSLMLEN